eukprot:3247849-Rhodomonas_salina.1
MCTGRASISSAAAPQKRIRDATSRGHPSPPKSHEAKEQPVQTQTHRPVTMMNKRRLDRGRTGCWSLHRGVQLQNEGKGLRPSKGGVGVLSHLHARMAEVVSTKEALHYHILLQTQYKQCVRDIYAPIRMGFSRPRKLVGRLQNFCGSEVPWYKF